MVEACPLEGFVRRSCQAATEVLSVAIIGRGLIRQRWSIENEWHWERDVQLGEDAHRYTDRKGVPLLSMLRTIGM
jgi:hypothetical protein